VKRIREASVEDLSAVVPQSTARAVYEYFRGGEEERKNDISGGEEKL